MSDRPKHGSASRGGTPNARPEVGQWPPEATVKPAKAGKSVEGDDPEAAKIEKQARKRHKERIAADPAQSEASYSQYELDLEAAGVEPVRVGRRTFWKFKPSKYPHDPRENDR